MRSFRYIAKCVYASSIALALFLISSFAYAQGVTQVLGASSDATAIVGQCGSFGFLQATPINLNSNENNGQSLDVSKNGSFWYSTVADNGAPNNRWIVYGVNGGVLKRLASSLLFTAVSDPTAGSIMTVHKSSGNLIVSNSFATVGCTAVSPCERFFTYNGSLGGISNTTMTDFNDNTGTVKAFSLDDTLYESNSTTTAPNGVVLRSVDMLSGNLNFATVKNTSVTTNFRNLAGVGSALYAAHTSTGQIYEFSTSTLLELRTRVPVLFTPGPLAVDNLAVFVNQATGTPRLCRINLSTFNQCNQTYSYTGSDGSITSAVFTDPVNNKVYEMRNDGAQDTILIRYTAGPDASFAFDARFSISPTSPNNLGMRVESYAFNIPTQRITWIGSTGTSPAQVNSVRVCDLITR